MLDGKKPKRVMVNLTEEMWKQVYALCDLTGLKRESIIRLLIAGALSQKLLGTGNVQLLHVRQQSATQPTFPTFAEEMAKPQKASNRNKEQRREMA